METDNQMTERFTDANAELIHERSVEILQEIGFCVPEETALDRLARIGFDVNRETQMVRLTPGLVEDALKTLPRDVRFYARSGENELPFSNGSYFMGAGTPVNVLDLESGKKRAATREDVSNLVLIQDALSQVDIVRPTVTASDQGEYSDLVEIAEMIRHTTKPMVHRTLTDEHVDSAVEMLSLVAGGEEALRTRPRFATLYCPISPGYFSPENIRCMTRWAHHGVPITILSMAMGGASAPATLLGELIVINTDILAWIVALQLLYPGIPLLYGSVSSVLDMRTGLLPLGAPERGTVNSGAAVMARFYGIPSMCGGLSSDAKDLDAQAGFEKAVTAVPLMLEGANIIYGVGATDAGSSISYTQMILDNELIAGLRRMVEGITLHDVEEEVALIKSNTPRGNFLREKHTKERSRRHWLPEILDRDTYETWLSNAETIKSKCRSRAHDLLATHKPEPLGADVEAEMERILRSHLGEEFHFEPLGS
jgi:trimethylamine--corrinoid protein Co-methyltransferase